MAVHNVESLNQLLLNQGFGRLALIAGRKPSQPFNMKQEQVKGTAKETKQKETKQKETK